MDEEDPKIRTKRMKEELRKKILKHEKESRESGGKNLFDPPKLRRTIALPLFGIAITLYGLSIYGFKKKASIQDELSPRLNIQTAKDIAEHDSRELFNTKYLDDEEFDPELIRDDKNW